MFFELSSLLLLALDQLSNQLAEGYDLVGQALFGLLFSFDSLLFYYLKVLLSNSGPLSDYDTLLIYYNTISLLVLSRLKYLELTLELYILASNITFFK